MRCLGALILLHTLDLSYGLAISEDCPDRLLDGGVVRGDVQELASGVRLLMAELMDKNLQVVSIRTTVIAII
jgi:hypothetical protein